MVHEKSSGIITNDLDIICKCFLGMVAYEHGTVTNELGVDHTYLLGKVIYEPEAFDDFEGLVIYEPEAFDDFEDSDDFAVRGRQLSVTAAWGVRRHKLSAKGKDPSLVQGSSECRRKSQPVMRGLCSISAVAGCQGSGVRGHVSRERLGRAMGLHASESLSNTATETYIFAFCKV